MGADGFRALSRFFRIGAVVCAALTVANFACAVADVGAGVKWAAMIAAIFASGVTVGGVSVVVILGLWWDQESGHDR